MSNNATSSLHSADTHNILCKYYLHGACKKGTLCPFAHDLKIKANNICKFYLAGNCSYGKSCRYDHVKTSRDVLKPINLPKEKTSEKNSCFAVLSKRETKEPNWVDAAEFIPGKKSHPVVASKEIKTSSAEDSNLSYSSVTSLNISEEFDEDINSVSFESNPQSLLCPFAAVRQCPFGYKCEYMHGLLCDVCGLECLDPSDLKQQEDHKKECLEQFEKEMDKAFASQKSEGVACSICLDIVKEKADVSDRIFGILENCTHPFCLSCIRKWRRSVENGKGLVRLCPICRINSWFVTPSEFWVDNNEEKRKLIESYKSHLSQNHCRSFNFGKGECQFGTSCFYKHQYEDGTKQSTKPDFRYQENAEGEVIISRNYRLNEFIAARDV